MAAIKYVAKENREEPMEYVSKVGTYRFEIVKHEIDGYTAEGNEKNKFTFKCRQITMKDGKPDLDVAEYGMNGFYTADEKQLWVFNALQDALKIAYAVEPCDLVGRYFVAEVTSRMYNDKKYHDINPRSYKYSKMNDDLPPVKEAKDEVPATYEAPALDIDEDEMPF